MTLFESMMQNAPADPLDRLEYEKKVLKDIESLGLSPDVGVRSMGSVKLPMLYGTDGKTMSDGTQPLEMRSKKGGFIDAGEMVRRVSLGEE
jgi:hypothetical protein